VGEISRVERLLRAREAQGLEYSIWARVAFLAAGGAITLINSQSPFDTFFTSAILLAIFALMTWCLTRVRQQENLLLVGRTLVASDAVAILSFPIVWYVSVGGPDNVSAAFLLKNSQVPMYSVIMALNCLALRPLYPTIIAAVACFQMIVIGLYALTDDRVAVTIDNVEQVLGPGIKPGFFVWFFMATILIGLFMNLATARARRTIREAAELEVENVHIREEQARRVMEAKIRALGSLVAGIAHEINTPLAVITSSVSTVDRCAARLVRAVEEAECLAELREDEKMKRAIATLRELQSTTAKAADRMTELVSSLKDFVRLDKSEVAEINVHECLDRVLTLISPRLKGRVEIVRNFGDVPLVHCRPHEVSQVLMTILVNAFEAMKGEGVLELATASGPDDAVLLDIGDTGCGMTEQQLEQLFDVRFSDKSGRVGVRLGLPTARVILEDQGGRVNVESSVGKGTKFHLELPRSRAGGEKPA
jgi:signal transduction histidine kinase